MELFYSFIPNYEGRMVRIYQETLYDPHIDDLHNDHKVLRVEHGDTLYMVEHLDLIDGDSDIFHDVEDTLPKISEQERLIIKTYKGKQVIISTMLYIYDEGSTSVSVRKNHPNILKTLLPSSHLDIYVVQVLIFAN